MSRCNLYRPPSRSIPVDHVMLGVHGGYPVSEASTRPPWNPRTLPARGTKCRQRSCVLLCLSSRTGLNATDPMCSSFYATMPGRRALLADSCSSRHRSRMGPAPCGTAENDHSRGHCAWAGWRNVSSFRMTRNPDTVARKLHTHALAVATGLCRRRCDLEAFCVR